VIEDFDFAEQMTIALLSWFLNAPRPVLKRKWQKTAKWGKKL
jgi:hypothetical protein